MFNPIKPNNVNHPSINALGLLGPRALIVIARNKSITGIAAYEQTLTPKVGRFMEVRSELRKLAVTLRTQAASSAAEIAGLDDVTRICSENLQLSTSLNLDDIDINDSRAPEAILDNAGKVMELLQEHSELPLAAEALAEIEAKHASAKTAYDATQEGRVAVQVKQQELRAVAEDVHKELVKLRRVIRIALGSRHIDHQRLRVRNARPGTEDLDETEPETEGTSPPTSAASDPSPTG